MHVNIQSWNNNHYLLKCSLSQHNPDVILLNETSAVNKVLKIYGYKAIHKCVEYYAGVAIFVKCNIAFNFLEFDDPNILAIKVKTALGPLIIVTSYTPPRYDALPSVTINKILNFKLPTVFISDFNATHPLFDNTNNKNNSNSKGKQLNTIINAKNLTYLGPDFETFCQGNRRGKPDLIICNSSFRLFHHLIQQGEPVGSDHVPIIFKIQTKPFIILNRNKRNLSKINIDKYKENLSSQQFQNLDGEHFTSIDNTLSNIENVINAATELSCPLISNKVVKSYSPTKEIKTKLKHLQGLYHSYYLTSTPSIQIINSFKRDLLWDIKIHSKKQWDSIVKLAFECYEILEKSQNP